MDIGRGTDAADQPDSLLGQVLAIIECARGGGGPDPVEGGAHDEALARSEGGRRLPADGQADQAGAQAGLTGARVEAIDGEQEMGILFVVFGGELEHAAHGYLLAGTDLLVEVVGGGGWGDEGGGAEEAEEEKKEGQQEGGLKTRTAAGDKEEDTNKNSSQMEKSWLLFAPGPGYADRKTEEGSGQGEGEDNALLNLGNFLISPAGWSGAGD